MTARSRVTLDNGHKEGLWYRQDGLTMEPHSQPLMGCMWCMAFVRKYWQDGMRLIYRSKESIRWRMWKTTTPVMRELSRPSDTHASAIPQHAACTRWASATNCSDARKR